MKDTPYEHERLYTNFLRLLPPFPGSIRQRHPWNLARSLIPVQPEKSRYDENAADGRAGKLCGGVLRFLLTRFVQINSMSSFPWGTTAVNLLGCLVLGVLYGLFSRGLLLHTETRLFLTVGLCGGFTTFSTLMNESFLLLKEGNFPAFFLYTLLSFAGGLIAIGLGYLAAR